MGAAGADISADLGQLVDRHEHPVRSGVLQVEVVARDACHRLGVKAGEARYPVVLVDHDVAGTEVGEAAQNAAPAVALRLGGGAPAPEEPVLGYDRQVELRGDEPALEARLREDDLLSLGGFGLEAVLLEPADLEAPEVVCRPLAVALAGE